MAGKRITGFRPGQAVWVRGIVSHEIADWVEVFFNNDQHSIYIEDKRDLRRARRRTKKGEGRK